MSTQFYSFPTELTTDSLISTARRALMNRANRCIECRNQAQAMADELTNQAIGAMVDGRQGRAAVLADQAAGYVAEANSYIQHYRDFCHSANTDDLTDRLLAMQIAAILEECNRSAARRLEAQLDLIVANQMALHFGA